MGKMISTALKIVLGLYLLIFLSFTYDEIHKRIWPATINVQSGPIELPDKPLEYSSDTTCYYKSDSVYFKDTVADLLEDYRDDFEFY